MRYLVVLVAFLFFSCSEKPIQNVAELGFTKQTYTQERCVDNSCAKVKFSYLIAENSPAAKQINEDIMEQMLLALYTETKADNLDSAANDFLDTYEDFKTEFPESPGEWTAELEVELSYKSDSTLSFKFSEFNYSGGAHPNSSVYYMNFDKQTGDFLSLDRVVLNEQKMLELAEVKFREYHDVEDSVSLEEDGRFFLPETGFFLPNAIGYERDKFLLTYIPYEIGPYVMGYTELEFELKDLAGIVRTK